MRGWEKHGFGRQKWGQGPRANVGSGASKSAIVEPEKKLIFLDKKVGPAPDARVGAINIIVQSTCAVGPGARNLRPEIFDSGSYVAII